MKANCKSNALLTKRHLLGKPSSHLSTSREFLPSQWKEPCVHTECTLHQLSPYIGKLKSSIAADLIKRFSKPGDLIVDPFSGSGTIPLEAGLNSRHVLSADISPYASLLTKAKLSPPQSLLSALTQADTLLHKSESRPRPDLRRVPKWVRQFFHPQTLIECIKFAEVCGQSGAAFLLACFLGILHHQRPGFLSYPSSHLVPYLRTRLFPQESYPELYAYREIRPRLMAKVERAFKRVPTKLTTRHTHFCKPVEELDFPRRIDALITSPPYMNALDYGRDNRLRLWFLGAEPYASLDRDSAHEYARFVSAIKALALKLERSLKPRGYAVFIVGDHVNRNSPSHPSEVVSEIMQTSAPSVKLRQVLIDIIPDIRRSRREFKGVKAEHILVFQRRKREV